MNIYQSIAKIMEDIPAIGKDKVNNQQHFKFRGIDDVMNVLHPLLSKYKVFITPEVLEQTREERNSKQGGILIYSICKIKFTFHAEDGTTVTATTIGEGMDSGDKATNKAMAIAMKYALFQVFCIPTEEMVDPDSESPEVGEQNEGEKPIDSTMIKALRMTIDNLSISTDEVITALKAFKHTKLSELKVKEVQEFRKKLGA